jgi:hypothetical protein
LAQTDPLPKFLQKAVRHKVLLLEEAWLLQAFLEAEDQLNQPLELPEELWQANNRLNLWSLPLRRM